MRNTVLRSSSRQLESVLAVTTDLFCVQLPLVNVYLYGKPRAGDRQWALIDTGMPTSGRRIVEAAEECFGRGARPAAILLTHGHFDHRGAVRQLAEMWDVPVYAHRLELPYLTGLSDYPPPDPSVGGGAMARLSPLFPRRPIDLGYRIQALPEDGTVPGMPGWRWIHTPGHTPGHVSFFRDTDRALIAGDAFVTQRQESALAVLNRWPEVSRPPAYFTPDWEAAGRSVRELASLQPSVAATGHGIPLHGQRMRNGLEELAEHFELEIPSQGRYVRQPALADEQGVLAVPPATGHRLPLGGTLLAAGLLALSGVALMRRRAAHSW
ncbi:MAG TPA: MBL fold metallo-hydrolase [Thermoanaerobaculia bacterium]|nr:MBL fold metallo-hydrolase [Thermoanaerobaculia bacterium]